jgi:hypothetical protein
MNSRHEKTYLPGFSGKRVSKIRIDRPKETVIFTEPEEEGACYYCGEPTQDRDLLLRWSCGKCKRLAG